MGDLPSVPLCVHGRATALKEAMAAHSSPQQFVDRVIWSCAASSGSTSGGVADTRDAQELLKEAQESQARWASVAAELYGALTEVGGDHILKASPAEAPSAIAADAPATAAVPSERI